jgi:CheY-like chemotaxis protein
MEVAMKIIVCTPVNDIRLLFHVLFEREDFEVIDCARIDHAGAIATQLPDAVFIDPWEHGQLERMRQNMNVFRHHNIPVIFFTTRVIREERQELEDFRPDLVISLPDDLDLQLPERIRDLIREKKRRAS